MKAIVHTQYGSPDVPGVLQFKEVETPLPTDHQLLIKVHAAFVNARDGHLVKSQPALLRLIVGSGLLKPKDQKLGADIAGQVEAIGNTVTQFQIGDEVFGVGVGGFTDITQQDLWVVKALHPSHNSAALEPRKVM